MNHTGLLPSILLGAASHWLPLSSATANVMAQAILARQTNPADALGERLTMQVADRLRCDPAFRLWTLLERSVPIAGQAANQSASEKLVSDDSVSVIELAEQAVPLLSAALRCGNRQIAAPAITQRFQAQWRELYRDPTSWNDPGRWLSVTGCDPAAGLDRDQPIMQLKFGPPPDGQTIGPPDDAHDVPSDGPHDVPNDRRHDVPSDGAPGGEPDYGANQLDLAHWLRVIDRQHVLESRFAHVLSIEKDAALKELAYGLSHEINNPLANISTRAQSLARDETQSDRKRMLDQIHAQSMRAYEMIADMMFYASPSEANYESVDLSELVTQTIDEFRSQSICQGIGITQDIVPMCRVTIDPHQFSDVLRAVLRNAAQAIWVPGQIDIQLSMSADDHRVQLRISDSGVGLTPQQLRHAFDPYFSGREAGRGLGLGLCKSRRIIERHGGEIQIRSAPVGTCVTITVPLAD